MTEYVAGFYFNEDYSRVALIEKQRPDWQKGKFNGIGGKIEWEIDKNPYDAMVREFKEETGCQTKETDWDNFLELSGENFRVYFFRMYGNKLEELVGQEDEVICSVSVSSIPKMNMIIPNLKWIVPMALENPQVTYIVRELLY